MRSRSWAISCMSTCPRSARTLEQGKIARFGGVGQGGVGYLLAGSGEVIEINQALADTPEKLNEDPHGAAWLVKVQLTAPAEVQNLMIRRRLSNVRRSRKLVALSSEVRFRAPRDAGRLRRESLEDLFAHLPAEARLNRPLEPRAGQVRVRDRRLLPRRAARKRQRLRLVPGRRRV